MWVKIKGNLVNLDNVTEIYRNIYDEKRIYVGSEAGKDGWFEFDTQEERDQEFDRLERLLLNERSW